MPEPRTGKTTVVRFTIWDNFERHCLELRAIGAGDADLSELRAAAQAVADAEDAAGKLQISLAKATAPFRSVTGWIIKPPTVAARSWARRAVLKATGGKTPAAASLSELLALLAGLLVLRIWGEGERDLVMELCTAPGALAERLGREADAAGALRPDQLGAEWMQLMGIAPDKKKTSANYRAVLARLRARSTPTTTPPRSTPRRSRRACSA